MSLGTTWLPDCDAGGHLDRLEKGVIVAAFEKAEGAHLFGQVLGRQLLALGSWPTALPGGIGEAANLLTEKALKLLLPLLVELGHRAGGAEGAGGPRKTARGDQPPHRPMSH